MEKRLYRNEQDKILAGVSSGLADYFDMDVTWVRIIFVFAAVFGFSGVIIYVILWIVIPPKPFNTSYNTDYKVYDDKTSPYTSSGYQAETPQPPYLIKKQNSSNTRLIGGLILVFFGAYFLLEEFDVFPYWFNLHKLWPVVFIVLGVLIISKTEKKPSYPLPEEDVTKEKIKEQPTSTNSDQTSSSSGQSLTNDYEEQ
jgi:phage shock protein C